MRRIACLTGLLFASAFVVTRATEPNQDTRRWWAHVQFLASDDMRGRDTGSEEYKRAANYVAQQFERDGIKAAGEGGYFQAVPVHALRLRQEQSSIELTRNGRTQPLRWLQQVTVAPALMLPSTVRGDLVFVGSDNGAGRDLTGKIVVRLNPERLVGGPALPPPPFGVAAVIGIDSSMGPEPLRWPSQYSVTMTLADTPMPSVAGPLTLRFNPAFADVLLAGSGHTYQELLDLGARGQAVPSFPIGASLRLAMQFDATSLTSDNVIGILPGSDPALASQFVVLSAHLDGYGIGEPWNGDRIYNGAFDDAAYVATLLDLAERLRESGTKLRRPLLVAVVTGEEKGLLGSRYFTQHPTVPKNQMVADLNLDQLRPIFPLKILTALAVDDSTLGDTARQVARTMDIRIQPDPEPLRNLLRRSDNWNFIQNGVPAISFIFGFEKGSAEEGVYRRWYADRYHTPLDDLEQPWDPTAAAKFNTFFGKLVEAVANAPERPRWKPGSAIAPR